MGCAGCFFCFSDLRGCRQEAVFNKMNTRLVGLDEQLKKQASFSDLFLKECFVSFETAARRDRETLCQKKNAVALPEEKKPLVGRCVLKPENMR